MKVVKSVIQITKEQAAYLRQHEAYLVRHNVREYVTRTMKQKSNRHNYWACEDKCILNLLNEYNKSQNIIMTYGSIN